MINVEKIYSSIDKIANTSIQDTFLYKYKFHIDKVFKCYTCIRFLSTIGMNTANFKVPSVAGTKLNLVGTSYTFKAKDPYKGVFRITVISLEKEECYIKTVHKVDQVDGMPLQPKYQIEIIFTFFYDTTQHFTYVAHSIGASTLDVAYQFPLSHFCISYANEFCKSVDKFLSKQINIELCETDLILRTLENVWEKVSNFSELIKELFMSENGISISNKILENNKLSLFLTSNNGAIEIVLHDSIYTPYNSIILKIEKIFKQNLSNMLYITFVNVDEVSVFIKIEERISYTITEEERFHYSLRLQEIIKKFKRFLESCLLD